jgi:collagen type I/II/III/V/XI/XXIV/XXVII alpha
VVNGTVTMGGGTLAAPASGLTIGATGDVAGFGAVDAGTVVNDSGTIEAEGGTLTVPQISNVSGAGTLQADAGGSLVLQAFGGAYGESIVNNGTIDAAFGGLTGTLDISGVYSGTGGFLILGGSGGAGRTILELSASVSANVAFDTNVGELLLDSAPSFSGTISDFGNSDAIVMPTVANAAIATLSGDDLNLKSIGGTVLQTITLDAASMNYSTAIFSVNENGGNTQATVTVTGVQAACFAAGTRIKTQTGEVPVEQLAAGDIVCANFAGTAPVVWLGHRHVDCRRHPEPSRIWPVRVSAHAFGPRMPVRDLVLSPDHAVFMDDVLIPIKYLINGTTIVQEKVDTITYYHVELGEHDVLLAEGVPVESYLENGDRGVFDNAGVIALHPDFGMRREAFGCARLIVTGAKLDAVIARVRARAARERPVGLRRVA